MNIITNNRPRPLADWHTVVSETYFSGVLFRWGAEDTVIVGRYFT